jgi:hypothetical protein
LAAEQQNLKQPPITCRPRAQIIALPRDSLKDSVLSPKLLIQRNFLGAIHMSPDGGVALPGACVPMHY